MRVATARLSGLWTASAAGHSGWVDWNSLGWPLTAFVVKNPDGTERTVDVPEQPLQNELGWFQAYVKDCRGWLDPQKLLPAWVDGRK